MLILSRWKVKSEICEGDRDYQGETLARLALGIPAALVSRLANFFTWRFGMPDRMTRVIVVFYSLLAVVGAGLISWRVGEEALFYPWAAPSQSWGLPLAICLGLVFSVHFLSRIATRRWCFMQRSAADVRGWLGDMGHFQIFLIALFSGLGEEVFFRGWLLNEVGLGFSSLLFALAHFPPKRDWRYWPAFAFFMGLILGLLCLWSGSLVFAIAAHSGVNYFNLRFIFSFHRSEKW